MLDGVRAYWGVSIAASPSQHVEELREKSREKERVRETDEG